MNDRLNVLLTVVVESRNETVISGLAQEKGEGEVDVGAAASPGWRALDSSCWKPCPIGVSGLVCR